MIICKRENYVVRTWEPGDAQSLARHINNKKIWDCCRDGLPSPYRQEDAYDFLAKIRQQMEIADFCVVVDGAAVGGIGFVPQTDVERYNAEVGYWLSEEYWNRGIMSGVVRDAVHYYMTNTEIVRVFARVYGRNIASVRVLEKTGFRKVGMMRNSFCKNGELIDSLYFELLKEEINRGEYFMK